MAMRSTDGLGAVIPSLFRKAAGMDNRLAAGGFRAGVLAGIVQAPGLLCFHPAAVAGKLAPGFLW
ncbi:hypothetical protein [Azotobacter chroococcum]|uniref:hypothetical protein n=1 Tax=Azotobacter chroococcum TaxID=353 RepID=UPI001186DDF2|nr:hypothetical protein [Azotobacter chroococcum]